MPSRMSKRALALCATAAALLIGAASAFVVPRRPNCKVVGSGAASIADAGKKTKSAIEQAG